MLGDDTKKGAIIDDLNQTRNLQLSPQELAKLKKTEFIGVPLNQLKQVLNATTDIPASSLPGIPTDTTNNELTHWMRSVTNVYAGGDQKDLEQMLLVKGDGDALYPIFKNIKTAFKANNLMKFRIVTEGEGVPEGSELWRTGGKEK